MSLLCVDHSPGGEQCGEGTGFLQESHGAEMEDSGAVHGLHLKVCGGRETPGGGPLRGGGKNSGRGVQLGEDHR